MMIEDTKDIVFSFIDGSESAFVIATYPEKNLIYQNKIAKDEYGICEGTKIEDFFALFRKSKTSLDYIKNDFVDKGCVHLKNVLIVTKDGVDKIVDISIGYLNQEKKAIFLQIVPKINSQIEIALYKLDQSDRAKAIFEFDEEMNIFCCNKYFCEIIKAVNTENLANDEFKLVDLFQNDEKTLLKKEIFDRLSKKETFFKEVKIINLDKSTRWVALELKCHKISQSEEKITCTMVCIDNYIKKEEELSKNQQFFMAMQNLSDDIIYKVDAKTMTLYHSIKNDKIDFLGKEIPDYINTIVSEKLIHPDDASRYLDDVKKWYDGCLEKEDEAYRFILENDNEYKWYTCKSIKIFDENGDVEEVFGKLVNVDKQKKLQDNYSLINKYFMALDELTEEILFHIDIKTTTFRHADKNAVSFGMPIETPDFVNNFIDNKFIHPEDVDLFLEYTKTLLSGIQTETEIRLAIDINTYAYFHVKSKFIYDENDEPIEIFGTMENIEAKKALEIKATHDLMTNVLNKVSFETEVENILKNSKENERHALIFVDLDDFKGVNDTLGHQFGDYLLISVGKRLKRVVRDSDLVGRVGGDEFVLLLRNIHSNISALERIELLLQSLRREFSFEGTSRKIKASLGISTYPEHGLNYKELIAKSDKALYQSKRKGKDIATLYNEEMK